ncbi:hypothetical protein [Citrobacter koseri]|uniref:hypothetical protein n=1 Tax=Citrobacter koseri TaxID=545 RepID=UPI0022AD7FDC|nr:hypothetical protein [Citrobacter koseri]
MKDEDLDRCPRCKEDMWAGNTLCKRCQREDELDEWPGGDGNPFPGEIECDICGHISTDPEGRHFCCEDNSDD